MVWDLIVIQLLFSRLRLFKSLSAKRAAEGSDRVSKGISSTNSTTASSSNPERFYELILEMCERLFDNEIDQHVFEDQVRHLFGLQVSRNPREVESIITMLQDAYKIFTVDKVIGAIIKQVCRLAVFSEIETNDL